MNNLKFSIYTLGCKTNQSESDCIAGDLISRGFRIVPLMEKPDFSIINTCSVTSASDSKARQLIRRIKQANPVGKIIVTGCFVVFNEKFLAENKIDFIIRNEDKYNIPELVYKIYNINFTDKAGKMGKSDKAGETGAFSEIFPSPAPALPYQNIHSRALVKIQDGCEQRCSYCIVPLVRGSYKSVQPGLIVDTINNLSGNGFEEIVITGIHIGKYGVDLGQNCSLASLLKTILGCTTVKRIRLSSIEVNEINRELIEVVKQSNGRVAPHFHIPLQSGSTKILKLMNRHYTRQYFLDAIKSIEKKLDGIAITTDIIVGFPGESEADFIETLKAAKEVSFSKMHVFKYSARTNTTAALMEGQVSEIVKSNRSHIARKLGEELRDEYIKSNLNNELEVLCEEIDSESGSCSGTSGNYIKVYFKLKPGQLQDHVFETVRGKLLKIKAKELYRGGLTGEPQA